ncbi:MAG: hypothetical protein ISS36_03510 [Candidatus Aenigmarchaeota archaeon]|nr:hypothetical protein [Candidatus Aenigmarchaeota archaeon]
MFVGKIWKQGKSLVLTIPQGTYKSENLSEGDSVKTLIEKIDEEKLRMELEIKKLRSEYEFEGYGSVLSKKDEIIKIDIAFFSLTSRAMVLNPGESFQKLEDAPKDRVYGIILKGRVLNSKIFSNHKYGKNGIDELNWRYLTGIETMILKTEKGEIEITDLEFHTSFNSKSPGLNKIEFSGVLKNPKKFI